MNHKIILASILLGGLFVGIIKGQEARTRWLTKMKSPKDGRNLKLQKDPVEVALDDFEMASFHQN